MSVKKPNLIQEKRECHTHKDSACKTYNARLNDLTSIAVEKNRSDDNVQIVRDTLRAAQAADATTVLIKTGPFVWKYREQISKRDENFFINNKFQSEIDESKRLVTKQDFNDDEITSLMQSLKRTYHLMTMPEREVIWRHVIDMLKAYAQFLGCEKKLLEIEQEIKLLAK